MTVVNFEIDSASGDSLIHEFAGYTRKGKPQGKGQKEWRERPENIKKERERERRRRMEEFTKKTRRENEKAPSGSICPVCLKLIENGDGVWHDVDYINKTVIAMHKKCHRDFHDIIERSLKRGFLPSAVRDVLYKDCGWMPGKFTGKSHL